MQLPGPFGDSHRYSELEQEVEKNFYSTGGSDASISVFVGSPP
jgi:hypothetical protein